MFKTSQAKIGWILDIYDTRLLRSTSEYVQESTDFSVLVWLVKTFWVNFKWYSFTCVKCRITTFNISWFPYILCQFFILRRSFALPRSLTMMFNTWSIIIYKFKCNFVDITSKQESVQACHKTDHNLFYWNSDGFEWYLSFNKWDGRSWSD